jgi:hypothetical protein
MMDDGSATSRSGGPDPIRESLRPISRATIQKPSEPRIAAPSPRHQTACFSDSPEIVKNDLKRVVEAWLRYQSGKGRNSVFFFLEALYDVGRRWKAQRHAEEYSRLALGFLDPPVRMRLEVYAVLITCSVQIEVSGAVFCGLPRRTGQSRSGPL